MPFMVSAAVKFIALQPIIHVKILYLEGFQVKSGDPPVCTQPDTVFIIRKDPVNYLIGQSFTYTEPAEGFCGRVEHI